MIRVLVAEDMRILRDTLVSVLNLEDDLKVVAQVAAGTDIVPAALAERPDLAVLDIDLPGLNGIAAAAQLHERLPSCRVVILTVLGRPGQLREALDAHVSGFMVKDAPSDQLIDVLRRVAAGGTALDPEVVAQLLVRRGPDPLAALTQRERDVLALMAEGRSNTEIAASLVITDSAVSKHINSIFTKLGLHPGDTGHRRVLAVLRYLGAGPAA